MTGFLCCFKGEGSNQVVQDPPLPSEPSQPSDSSDSSESIIGEPLGDNDSPVIFRWEEILEGTDNLRITHFLGEGKFGKVYRCDLPRINKVGAVKIQDPEKAVNHPQSVEEFTMLHSANHPNVIKLLGKCSEIEHQAIVYEFLPKGSLDCHLFAHARPGLDWETRMRIAVGVAEALTYLHKELKIIHRDVKASNVLLDEGYVPKLIDFGLATKVVEDEDGDEQQIVIKQDMDLMETQECMAPETEDSGLVSTRSDVYSYGVFLFTLFTGRKAYDLERSPETRKITDWLKPVWSSEKYVPLVVDVALGRRFSVIGIIRLVQAARLCIHPNASTRPNMDFVESLVRDAAAYPVPA